VPYPTPPEPAAEESLRWFLVAVPDRLEYVRAGLGAYTEMAKDYMWGLEGYESTSEDAAQSWAKAVAATLEALEMGFPDILLGYIDGVEELLEAIRDSQCCPEGGPAPIGFDGQFIGDELDIVEPPDVTPGTELPPGWVDHPDNPGDGSWDLALYRIALCDKANRFANALTATLRRWSSIASFNAWSFARELAQTIIAFVFPGRVDDLLLWAWDAYYDALDAIGDWLAGLVGLSAKDALAEAYADWLATEKDATVCAIMNAITADQAADDVRGILQGLQGGAAWSLLWSAFPFRFIMRKMFDMEDGYEGPYQSSCANCEPIYDFDETWTFDADTEGWSLSGGAQWEATEEIRLRSFSNPRGNMTLTVGAIRNKITGGVNTPLTIEPLVLEFDVYRVGTDTTSRVIIQGKNSVEITSVYYNNISTSPSNPTRLKFADAPLMEATFYQTGSPNPIMVSLWGWDGGDSYYYIDNVRVAGNLL